jgi:2',3'-cyclic-nucleotide 2'-phosphodiesterase (5'-nucleotidase family)
MRAGRHLDQFRSSGSSCTDPTQGCVGGYSRVKTVIDTTRPTHNHSLFLNAGDEFQVSDRVIWPVWFRPKLMEV